MKPDLLAEAKRLSLADRIELAEAIWDTVAEDAGADAMAVPLEHRGELDRRLDDPAEASAKASSWDEVRARLVRGR